MRSVVCYILLITPSVGSLALQGSQESRCSLVAGSSSSECVPPPKKACAGVCSLCLGTNQKESLERVLLEIQEKFHKAAYKVSSFSLSITLPASLLLRQLVLALYHDTPTWKINLKETLKSKMKLDLSSRLGLEHQAQSPFTIAVTFNHEETAEECNFLPKLFPQDFKVSKGGHGKERLVTVTNIQKVLNKLTIEECKAHNYWPPLAVGSEMKCAVVGFSHDSIFIGGRYNKYSRELSQTPWVVDGKKKTQLSIQEIVGEPFLKKSLATKIKFSSSGREDADVRMLGTGRPFVIELLDPKYPALTEEQILSIGQGINTAFGNLISVNLLQQVDKKDCDILKIGEEDKRKTYCALIWSHQPITEESIQLLNSHENIVLQQKTPVRVLHRRSLAIRERTIYSMHCIYIDSHHFKLKLSTQAGTYIKEFVHGDFGRTQPNLGSLLGIDVDIVALDVEEVALDWPPKS